MKRKKESDSRGTRRFFKIVLTIIILTLAGQTTQATSWPSIFKKKRVKVSAPKTNETIIDGRVTEEDFEEPLEKSIVRIKGTPVYTVTNRFGYYWIKIPPASIMVEAIHPNIYSEFYNVSTYDGVLTPMGAVRLEPATAGRRNQRDLASWVSTAKHPIASRTLAVPDLINQSGSCDFNPLLERQPSVYLHENGGALGSSELKVRGLSPDQNQVVFNGVSLNNPETGAMNTALYSGISDWAQDAQFTTGLASGKQSELGQASLLNVLPTMPRKKFGVNVLASTGVNGYLKTAATVHSGIGKRKIAFALKLDRTAGDGVPDFTGFESYGLLFNLYKEFSHMHSVLFTNVVKTWQSDLRDRPDSISRIARYGIDHNSSWGFLSDNELGWNSSFGITNLSILTHHWSLKPHTRLVSQLYAEFGNQARTFPQGKMNGQAPYQILNTDRGLIDFDSIYAYNQGKAISENEGISILADVSRTTRIGLQTQLIHEFDKQTKGFIGIDGEQYVANHFGALNNLIGAPEFFSSADVNNPNKPVQNMLQPGFLPKTDNADRVNHNYRTLIQKAGFSLNIEKTSNKAFVFAEGGLFIKRLKREDLFNYLNADQQQSSDWINQFGWRVNSGITYRLNEFHSLRLNGGANGSPARFNVLFPASSNISNSDANNQKLYAGDLAYVVNSGRLLLSLKGYALLLQDRTEIQRFSLNEGEDFAVYSGIEQFHRGIELSSQITYFKRFNFYVNASYGKWTYQSGANARNYDSAFNLISEKELPLKNYNTPNSAPISLYLRNEFNLFMGLELNLNYYHSFGTFAPLSARDFENTNNPEQLELPAFNKLGAGLNYFHEFRKKRSMHIFAEVRNLMSSKYADAVYSNFTNDEYPQNLVHYGSGMSWRAGLSFNF